TASDLEQLFGQHGTVESAQVITDRNTGQSKGFAFVEMKTDQEAQAAIAALNGKEMNGRPLTVNEAKPREAGGGGSGGGGGAGVGRLTRHKTSEGSDAAMRHSDQKTIRKRRRIRNKRLRHMRKTKTAWKRGIPHGLRLAGGIGHHRGTRRGGRRGGPRPTDRPLGPQQDAVGVPAVMEDLRESVRG